MQLLLKFVLVLGLVAVGVYFLLKGFGVAVPLIKYKGAEAHDIPAGVILVILGIALARLWKIQTSRTVVTETKREKDGETWTTKKVDQTIRHYSPWSDRTPPHDRR